MEKMKSLWLLCNWIFSGGVLAGIIVAFVGIYKNCFFMGIDSLIIILVSLLGALYTMNEFLKLPKE